MRKIFKKVVTAVASLAMMAGLVAGMPTMDAKAAPAANAPTGSPEICIKGNYDNWGSLTPMTKDGDVYTYTVTIADPETIDGTIKFMFSTNSNYGALNYFQIQDANGSNFEHTVAAPGQYEIKLDLSQGTWDKTVDAADCWGAGNPANDATKYKVEGAVSVTTNAVSAADVIAKIDEIGTVSLTEECLAKIEAAEDMVEAYQGNDADITNLATLTAARARYNELKAAADAAAAGKLVIYVKNSENWSAMKLYSWKGDTKFFGNWPGKDMTACTKNAGWYSAQFDITAAANLIFNDGNGTQTGNIEGVAAGKYWYTFTTNDAGSLEAVASTTAPAGWVDETAANIEVETTTTNTNTNTNTNTDTTPGTADATPVAAAVAAVVLMGLAVVVLNTKKANR